MNTAKKIINKKDIERYLGYPVQDYKIEPDYVNGKLVGFSIMVVPETILENINVSLIFKKDGKENN